MGMISRIKKRRRARERNTREENTRIRELRPRMEYGGDRYAADRAREEFSAGRSAATERQNRAGDDATQAASTNAMRNEYLMGDVRRDAADSLSANQEARDMNRANADGNRQVFEGQSRQLRQGQRSERQAMQDYGVDRERGLASRDALDRSATGLDRSAARIEDSAAQQRANAGGIRDAAGRIEGDADSMNAFARDLPGRYQSVAERTFRQGQDRSTRSAVSAGASAGGALGVRQALMAQAQANADAQQAQQNTVAQEQNQLMAMQQQALANAAGIRTGAAGVLTNAAGVDESATNALRSGADVRSNAAQVRQGVANTDLARAGQAADMAGMQVNRQANALQGQQGSVNAGNAITNTEAGLAGQDAAIRQVKNAQLQGITQNTFGNQAAAAGLNANIGGQQRGTDTGAGLTMEQIQQNALMSQAGLKTEPLPTGMDRFKSTLSKGVSALGDPANIRGDEDGEWLGSV